MKIASIYTDKTTWTVEQALEAMHSETFISSSQAKEIGFATSETEEIEEAVAMMIPIKPDHKKIKAVALFNPKTLKSNSKMQNDNKKKGIKASIAKIQNLIGLGARNLVVTSAEGTDIDFYEIEDEEDIQVGAKANIDSSPADGSHVMPSGQTYVFASGELTEIQEAESEEEASAEQIQQLQNQLSEKDTEIEELRSKMNAFTTEFTNLKRMIESPEIDEEPRDSNSSGEIGSRRDKVQNRASHL